jgi:ABC-type ATPase with predicted acetyltransferase domain
LTSYGVPVGIRVNQREALAAIREYLPPGWKPSRRGVVERLYSFVVGGRSARPGVRSFNILYGDARRLARSLDFQDVLDAFDNDLKLFVAEAARRRVFVHAGVVGWKGRAVMIPGRSLTGKTTLVAELVRQGFTYYSDEYAVLDERGRVHAYPRPLSIRAEGSLKQTPHPVEALGGKAGVSALPVALVVCGEFKPGARWRPRRLSAGEGILEILSNTIAARRVPEQALSTLQRVTAQAQVLKGVRGEAREAAASILEILEK